MKNIKNIVITGAGGQLGRELQELFSGKSDFTPHFFTRTEWDIQDKEKTLEIFDHFKPQVLINCAAFTQVDLAEEEVDECFEINGTALEHIANICEERKCLLLHFSTDYVFDGLSQVPYTENDPICPLSAYGESKSIGEDLIIDTGSNYVIIRTSWLYSKYGHNFVKTMLKLGHEKNEISVIDDQIASPTNARYLAEAVEAVILDYDLNISTFESDLYHFTHSGECSWNDFAKEIFKQKQISCKVNPITTAEYGSRAPRPAYSKLDCTKFFERYRVLERNWQEALADCLNKIDKNND